MLPSVQTAQPGAAVHPRGLHPRRGRVGRGVVLLRGVGAAHPHQVQEKTGPRSEPGRRPFRSGVLQLRGLSAQHWSANTAEHEKPGER